MADDVGDSVPDGATLGGARRLRRVTLARILFAVYLVCMGWIVFAPAPQAGHVTGVVVWVSHLVASTGVPYAPVFWTLEFVANIVLFLPLGVLLPLVTPRATGPLTVLAGFVVSTCIELAQYLLPSRYSSVLDIAANGLGGFLGWLIVSLALRLRNPAQRDDVQR